MLGYDPVWEKPLQEKDTGISWYYALDSDTVLRAFVYAFEAVAADQKDIVSNDSGQRPLGAGWEKLDDRLDVLDDRVELNVYRSTNTFAQPPDDALKDLMLEGIQRCFRLYDFTNALILSMRSLAVLEPLTDGRELAALYHIIALSAHNRHFFSQGNVALADFINHALQKALFYETDPATRVAILYRLIVTLGRRKNDQELAYSYLDQAHRILNEKTFKHKEVLTAWINNIHSFLLMKQGEIKEAIAIHEAGFYLLDHLHMPEQAALQIEIAFTKAVLAENLSTLNSLSGNFKQMKRWYAIESRLAGQWPSLHAVPSAEWQSFHYQNLELSKALKRTEQGLVKARNSFHYVLEYYFTVSAADIHYRLGNAAEALLYFRKALVFQSQVGYEYASLHALYICLVKTEIRLNRIEEALEDIATISTAAGVGTEREQIEIYLVTAYCHSCSGAEESAEEAINAAIDLAVAGGDCGTLVKVMLWAGKVCLKLNRKQDAIAAYHQALDMAQTVLDGVTYEPDTADLAEIYFRLYACSRKKPAYLEQAIYNLSLSLKEDADSWWTLPQVVVALSQLPVRQKNSYFKENKATIDRIRKAAQQRRDCQAYLNALKPNPIKQLTT